MTPARSTTEDDGWISPVFAGSHAAQDGADSAEGDPRGRAADSVPADRVTARVAREELLARVVQTVRDIPPGCVMTYGDVAAIVGCGPRQVGRIMATTQQDVPWWRVTNASGLLPEDLRGVAHVRYGDEGTPVRGERVDLTRARWRPV